MQQPTIAVVAGIRSQYMKAAALQRACTTDDGANWLWIDSGQHYDYSLSQQYFEEYQVGWNVRTKSGSPNQHPMETFAKMLVSLEQTFEDEKCELVVVFGDANTTLAGALSAARCQIPVCHIEAGVRTESTNPEELNRVLTDKIASLHIASSEMDLENLYAEGYGESSYFIGDLIQDLMPLGNYERTNRQAFALVTIHREENTKDLLILDSIRDLLLEFKLECVFLAHPRVMPLVSADKKFSSWNIRESVSHQTLLGLALAADLVLTDSGALQRECYYLGRSAIVVQDRPFWPVLVERGVNFRAVTPDELRSASKASYRQIPKIIPGLFGSPPIAPKIVRCILDWWRHGHQ